MDKLNPVAAATPDLLDCALGGYGRPRDQATTETFGRVGSLLRAGRIEAALAMLEYAQRLAPSDGGISLAIGLLRLSLGDPRAAEPLEMLAKRSDWREIRMALVRVRLRAGQIERAVVDLHAALTRGAAPRKPVEIKLANTVSQRVGAPGWCALDNAGHLIVGAFDNSAQGLVIQLDGVAIPASRRRRSDGLRSLRLPQYWPRAQRVDVEFGGRPLIGSPLDIAQIARVEGCVEAVPDTGALRGWCWFPAERERLPTVTITALSDRRRHLAVVASGALPGRVGTDEFGLPHGFVIDAGVVRMLGDAVAVTGPHGRPLYGSPLWPQATRDAARATVASTARLFPLTGEGQNGGHCVLLREASVPVTVTVPSRAAARQGAPPPVDIVIPVYAGLETTLACIDAVRADLAPGERIVVVADASPDAALIAALTSRAERGHILLQVETTNRGFPGAANIGLRLAAGHDAVLLNSDTIVTPGWLDRLRRAVHAATDIGTATPLSNDATIFSYPRPDAANPFPPPHETAAIAAIAAEANAGETVDVPTGHGFCLYIRADCLAETGVLREDLFAQGCGEENDFCMRARHLGWRHVAVPGSFVAHHGARSFNAARDDLMRRNLATLNRLHPGYDALIAGWQARDPLHEARRRIDRARLLRALAGRHSVLLVTHDRAGGVRRHVAERAAAIARDGHAPLVLRPANAKNAQGRIAGHAVLLDTGFDDAYPNLRFRLPAEGAALADLLQACGLREIAVHNLIGHHDSVVDLLLGQGVPLDVAIHDYAWFCPRITLTALGHRYCGEPPVAACRDCIAAHGGNLDEDATPDALIARSQRLFGAARTILAPSEDAARRIRNHFAVTPAVRPWETAATPAPRAVAAAAGRTRAVRVCLIGAIGPEKGYDALLACARAAAADRLKLEFVVVGHTSDDRRLLDTGAVRITGRYEEAEAVALIRAQQADFAWLPAAWPETWSYVLTLAWQAGLHVVVPDIGAPAERVRQHGGGLVVPINLPPNRLVELFRDPAPFREKAERRDAQRASVSTVRVPAPGAELVAASAPIWRDSV
jgi:GT2 family glycosyltransferase